MTDAYERRIARALDLAERLSNTIDPEDELGKAQADLGNARILLFYVRLLKLQDAVFTCLRDNRQTSLDNLLPHFPALLETVRRYGPEGLTTWANENLATSEQRAAVLEDCWGGAPHPATTPAENARFFARSLVQPYAEYLATRGAPDIERTSSTCPFCSSKPVAAVLRGQGEGARRSLICSLCATEWRYRRVLCPGCGEQDNVKLPVYTFDQFPHVRVDACETCRTWIKTLDLSREGRAVPAADDIGSAPVSVWAVRHNYNRLETNVLGM